MMPLVKIDHTPFLFTGTKGFCLFAYGQSSVTVGMLGMEKTGKRTLEQYFRKNAFANNISSFSRPQQARIVLLQEERRVVLQQSLELGKGMAASDYQQVVEQNDALIILMDGCRVLEEMPYAAQVEAHLQLIDAINTRRKIIIPIAAFGDRCAAKYPGNRKLELKYKLEKRLDACLSGYNVHDIVLANLLDEHHLAEIKKALFQ